MSTRIKRILIAVIAVEFLVCTGISYAAEKKDAKEQLEKATSGTQSTGKTFDGGSTPTDAYPKGNTNVPAVTGKPVDTSTGTVGGYDVNTSTGTSTGKRTGSESTK
jgi:hypothetical protein